MSFNEVPTAQRLLNGAKTLGILFRAGQRCEFGWSPKCSAPTTKFCRAKLQWAELAGKDGRPMDSGSGFEVVEAMTVSEFEALAVTATVDLLDLGPIKVGGRSGETPISELVKFADDPAGLESVVRVLKAFPGAKVIASKDILSSTEKSVKP